MEGIEAAAGIVEGMELFPIEIEVGIPDGAGFGVGAEEGAGFFWLAP